jgi:hypothetical protein
MAVPTTSATEPVTPTRLRLPRVRVGMFRYSVAHYLAALILLIVVAPIIADFHYGDLIDGMIMTFVLMSATIAVGHRRRTFIWALVLIVPAIAAKWLDHFQPDLVPDWIPVSLVLIYMSFVLVQLFLYIIRAPRVNSEVLCAGIATYLTLGVYWAALYVFVAATAPGSFTFSGGPPDAQAMSGFTALYFSFVTLTTVGFGDITPSSGIARMLAMTEAVVGVFYMAIMVARLVTLYSSEKPTAA